jgi:hypothetical protein
MEDNPLAAYLARTGRTKWSLYVATGLPWKTIHRVATSQHRPSHRVAEAISKATGGEVSIEEILAIGPGTPAMPCHGAEPRKPHEATR